MALTGLDQACLRSAGLCCQAEVRSAATSPATKFYGFHKDILSKLLSHDSANLENQVLKTRSANRFEKQRRWNELTRFEVLTLQRVADPRSARDLAGARACGPQQHYQHEDLRISRKHYLFTVFPQERSDRQSQWDELTRFGV